MATLKDNRQVIEVSRASLDMMRAALEQYAYDNQKSLSDEDMQTMDLLMAETKPLQTWAVCNLTTGKVLAGRFDNHATAETLAGHMTDMHKGMGGWQFQAYYLGVL